MPMNMLWKTLTWRPGIFAEICNTSYLNVLSNLSNLGIQRARCTKLDAKKKKTFHPSVSIQEQHFTHLYIRISSVELLYWIWYMRTPGMWFCGGHLMVAELDVRSDTLTLCWSDRAWPPLTLDLMDVGMSEGPGSGSSLGSKCGEGLTTSSTGAVASPAALDAMHVNFPESWGRKCILWQILPEKGLIRDRLFNWQMLQSLY